MPWAELVLLLMIGSSLLVVKKVILWPNLGHPYSNARGGMRFGLCML